MALVKLNNAAPAYRACSACLLLLMLSACAALGANGPSTSSVRGASEEAVGSGAIQIIHVTDAVARQAASTSRPIEFSQSLGALRLLRRLSARAMLSRYQPGKRRPRSFSGSARVSAQATRRRVFQRLSPAWVSRPRFRR